MVSTDLLLYSLLHHQQLLVQGDASKVIQKQIAAIESRCSPTGLERYQQWMAKAGRLTLWKVQGAQQQAYITALLPQMKHGNVQLVHPHHPLTIAQEAVFPIEKSKSSSASGEQELREQLAKVLSNPSVDVHRLYYALQQYGSCVPNNQGSSYLSMFNYLKNRAALVQCWAQEGADKTCPLLLVCGDLAGIQSFIYDIHSNKAAKSLKGRSFYIQYLLYYIMHRMVVQSGVDVCNIIYASGGKFFLMLPNTETTRALLTKVEEEAMQYIWNTHQDKLYFCLGWTPFSILENKEGVGIYSTQKTVEGNAIEGFGQLWEATLIHAASKKARRLKPLLTKDEALFEQLFRGAGQEVYNGPQVEVCAVTGEPIQRTQAKDLNELEFLYDRAVVKAAERLNYHENELPEEPIFVTPAVFDQVRLGYELIRNPYCIFDVNHLREGGFDPQKGIRLDKKASHSAHQQSYLLNPEEANSLQPFMFYGGHRQAMTTYSDERGQLRERVSTYEELAAPDPDAADPKRWNKLAVLRMDVDNLGLLFKKELQALDCTPTAYTQVSHLLHWFFAGHLNWLREQGDDRPNSGYNYTQHLNIQYAGGDDVFVVGRWKEVLYFARAIRAAFRQFTDGGLSISGGMVLVRPKFPLSKAALLAEEALDRAKAYTDHKDAFTFEDYVVRWGAEFDFTWKLYHLLVRHLQDASLSKGILRKLLLYRQQHKSGQLDWYWQSAYAFQKHQYYAERSKHPQGAPLIKALKEAIVSGRFQYTHTNPEEPALEYASAIQGRLLELCCLAAIWCDYSLR